MYTDKRIFIYKGSIRYERYIDFALFTLETYNLSCGEYEKRRRIKQTKKTLEVLERDLGLKNTEKRRDPQDFAEVAYKFLLDAKRKIKSKVKKQD